MNVYFGFVASHHPPLGGGVGGAGLTVSCERLN